MSTPTAASAPQAGPVWLAPPPGAARHLELIEQSHQRCIALGIDPNEVPELSPGPPSRLAALRERHRRLLEHAAPVMEMLVDQVVRTRSIVVLTGPLGNILHTVGDNGFLARVQQVALAPGINWSEGSKGTNAIGTALFDESPTLVHGDEHFVRANRFLTCSAAPIFDHGGRVMGVLDVTGDQRSYHPHTLALVAMAARMIEDQCFADRFRQDLRLHFHPQPARLGTVRQGTLALSRDGRILGVNRSALALLGLSAAALRVQGLEAVFGVGMALIADHGRRCPGQPLRVTPLQGASAGQTLFMRPHFDWPMLWPAHPADGAATEPDTQAPAALGADAEPSALAGDGSPARTLKALEVDAIRRAVAAAQGNVSEAARRLGVARNTIYRKLRVAGDSPR